MFYNARVRGAGLTGRASGAGHVVLEIAHRIDQEGNVPIDSVVEKLIFKPQDVVSIRAKDSDLEYATHDVFQIDSAITSKLNGNSRNIEERHLEPWDGSDADAGESPTALNGDARLDELELDHKANGWDANDMFRKNEEIYGVHSTYDHSLTGYTVQLQRKDTQDYRDAEAKAEEIAAEIESGPAYKARIDAENGDEEERFAAVVRPPNDSGAGNGGAGKYVIPNKRKNNQAGKLIKSSVNTVPVGSGNSSSNNTNVGAGGGKSPAGYGHGSPPASVQSKDKEHAARPPRHHLTPPGPPLDRRQEESQMGNSTGPSGVGGGAGAGGRSYAAQAGGYHAPTPFTHQHHAQAMSSTVITTKVNGEPRPAEPRHARHAAPAPFPPPAHHTSPAPPEHGRAPRHHAPAPTEPRRPNDDGQMQELRRFGQEFKLVSAGVAHVPPPASVSASGPAVNAPQPAAAPQPTPPAPVPQSSAVVPQSQPQQQSANPPPPVQQTGQMSQTGQLAQPPAPTTPEVSANTGTPSEPHAKRDRPPKQHTPPTAHHKPPPAPKEETSCVNEERSPASSTPPSSGSPGAERVTVPKSKLNPNAKEFNPAAKPFTPRSPSTPNPSRPHTPCTPGGTLNNIMGAGVTYMPAAPPPHMMMPAYMAVAAAAAQQPPAYLPHPHPVIAMNKYVMVNMISLIERGLMVTRADEELSEEQVLGNCIALCEQMELACECRQYGSPILVMPDKHERPDAVRLVRSGLSWNENAIFYFLNLTL
ncbi:Ataxin-2 [Eumeta japonica]|uniref:Ataxin-2 n=1 Tax=Eumeta variegata TaxID=151549 RepID=A0A4C1WWB0_EUMVA|nr:Ataxin-2 [Eumeta japonica]